MSGSAGSVFDAVPEGSQSLAPTSFASDNGTYQKVDPDTEQKRTVWRKNLHDYRMSSALVIVSTKWSEQSPISIAPTRSSIRATTAPIIIVKDAITITHSMREPY